MARTLKPSASPEVNRIFDSYRCLMTGGGRLLPSVELADLFFVAADFGGEGVDGGAELVDLDGESGQRENVSAVLAVLLDECV